jgi:hypothetical protein
MPQMHCASLEIQVPQMHWASLEIQVPQMHGASPPATPNTNPVR